MKDVVLMETTLILDEKEAGEERGEVILQKHAQRAQEMNLLDGAQGATSWQEVCEIACVTEAETQHPRPALSHSLC